MECAPSTRAVARGRACRRKQGAPHTGYARGSGAGCCPPWLRRPPRTARRGGTRGTRSRGTGLCVRRTRSVPHRAATLHASQPPVCDVPMQYSRPESAAVTPRGQTCVARDRRSAASMRDRGSSRRPHPAAYVWQAPARAAASRVSRTPASLEHVAFRREWRDDGRTDSRRWRLSDLSPTRRRRRRDSCGRCQRCLNPLRSSTNQHCVTLGRWQRQPPDDGRGRRTRVQ